MRKRYIPTRERRSPNKTRLSISLSGVSVSVLLLLAAISIISALQASFIKPYPKVSDREVVPEQKISDAVVARQVSTLQNTQLISIPNPTAFVATFPLEKSWPVGGRLTTLFSRYHPAVDIATTLGTPVHPFASGVVTRAGWWGGYGNSIVILHTDGWESLYAHLSRISAAVGQQVDLGTVIGSVGSTGRSTGPHLHFQLSKNGQFVNPLTNLP
ncbi:MAG TPA: peptidoglycan DD-metalloendopeptidase family protein [Candidatus Nanoarchaeia archaeon]|nr:hypothetical protein [uncultured archaeon]